MAVSVVEEVESAGWLERALQSSSAVVCHFWASWCEPCQQINKVFDELASSHPHVRFFRADADKLADVADKHQVSAVPYIVFFQNGAISDRLEGADVPKMVGKVEELSRWRETTSAAAAREKLAGTESAVVANGGTPKATTTADEAAAQLNKRLEELVKSKPIMLFMKGSAAEPRCGFSRQVVEILEKEEVAFSTFDILSDQEVREGLKKFSNWPTYPQLYLDGELVGGCDIVREMHASGELKGLFEEKGLVQKKEETEEEGGIEARLKKLINSSPTMLFMKGTASEPFCGFSRRVVNVLNELGVKFGYFDIFTDDEVRQGLKEFSNWPTYPQLYHKGELIGGCDIIEEMHKSGELKELLLSS
ncbi:hypothetical protein CBR_g35003 [Chara braunii]|uniref:Thioredoxin domain-containing protein n=1 Tax=Chara braunii TaxID=69332 RepID=A0A388LK74_CHABU|nr:hypothetical protein CBR_g35003 [Chara braunii]|eukprot:GBG82633.1 hypothetical protein CBR_g35003 [Chara braunii]